jgi:hypothetical protein
VVQCNVLAGGNASLYPTPNAFPTVAEWNAGFVNPPRATIVLGRAASSRNRVCNGAVPGADLAAVNAAIAAKLRLV